MAPDPRTGLRCVWLAIIRPTMAYIVASYVAGTTIGLGILPPRGIADASHAVASVLGKGLVLGIFVAGMAFIPTLLAAFIFHLTRVPRGYAEACAGALIGLAFSVPYALLFLDAGEPLVRALVAVCGSCGLAGTLAGLTYWTIIGRPENPKAR